MSPIESWLVSGVVVTCVCVYGFVIGKQLIKQLIVPPISDRRPPPPTFPPPPHPPPPLPLTSQFMDTHCTGGASEEQGGLQAAARPEEGSEDGPGGRGGDPAAGAGCHGAGDCEAARGEGGAHAPPGGL